MSRGDSTRAKSGSDGQSTVRSRELKAGISTPTCHTVAVLRQCNIRMNQRLYDALITFSYDFYLRLYYTINTIQSLQEAYILLSLKPTKCNQLTVYSPEVLVSPLPTTNHWSRAATAASLTKRLWSSNAGCNSSTTSCLNGSSRNGGYLVVWRRHSSASIRTFCSTEEVWHYSPGRWK